MENYSESSELYHHGILGMKWGVRRYQNPDGSLTELGREHYGVGERIKRGAKKVGDAAHDVAVWRARRTGKGLRYLSDEELNNLLTRQNKEVSYLRNIDYIKQTHRGRTIIRNVLERTVTNALNKASDKLVDNMFVDDDDELKDLKTEKDIQDAQYNIAINKARKDIISDWTKEYSEAKTMRERDAANARMSKRIKKLTGGKGKGGGNENDDNLYEGLNEEEEEPLLVRSIKKKVGN